MILFQILGTQGQSAQVTGAGTDLNLTDVNSAETHRCVCTFLRSICMLLDKKSAAMWMKES